MMKPTRKHILTALALIFFSPEAYSESEPLKNFTDSERGLLCSIQDHPVYDKTAVFGSDEPQIFFIRKDRQESSVHHNNFRFMTKDGGFSAFKNEDDVVLFEISALDEGFVNVIGVDEEHGVNMETADYPISGCLIIE